MLALLAAMREEIIDLQERIRPELAFVGQNCRVYRGKYENRDILLAQTGIGRENAEMTTRFLLENYPVTAMVSFGFAGALSRELRVGDVIVCSKLLCGNGQEGTCFSDVNLVSLTVKSLGSTGLRFGEGSSLTMTELVSRPEMKQALGRAFPADIVDMESYWIARIASERQIPFIAVRAVSDTGQDSLPPFDQILMNGKWRRGKAALHFISHPRHLIKLFALYRNARQARRNLTTVVGQLVSKI